MSTPDVFTYTDHEVRTVLIDGEPWFVLADVCGALGINNSRMVAARIAGDEKGVSQIDTPGGRQNVTIVNESGLYVVILRSDAPGAESFRRWVTHEVLPQIRRTGTYNGQAQLPQTYAEALRAAADAWEAKERLEAQAAINAPKVEAFDAFMEADGSYRMDAAAKTLFEVTGLGRNKLYAWLRDRGVLMSTNLPYQSYVDRGWFRVVVGSYLDHQGQERPTHTTYVTPKGIEGIRRTWMRGEVA